jgi:hypothetical protein
VTETSTVAPFGIASGENAAPVSDAPNGLRHPEEMKGSVVFKFGKLASMKVKGRTTPAGLIAAALLMAAIMVPVVFIVRKR